MKRTLLSILMIVLFSGCATAQIAAPSSSKVLSFPAHVINPRVLVSNVPLANLFLDKSKHRLVASVLNPPNSEINYQLLDWVENGHLKRLMKCQGRMPHVLWINFYTERVYWTTIPEFQLMMYLHVTSFHKSKQIRCLLDGWQGGIGNFSNLAFIAIGKQNSINYRVYWSGSSNPLDAGACVATYTENILLTSKNLNALPKQIFYDEPRNKIFLVYNRHLESLTGRKIPLPNGVRLESKQALKLPEQTGTVIDYSSTGKTAYYIDSLTKFVYKVSLSDGAVLAERSLTFTPVCIVVDNQKKRIYLLHKSGKIISSIGTF